MTTIGQNIRLARRRKKVSQAELSQLCGWSSYPSRISNYERGIREPKSDDLIKLAQTLNISVDWLYRDYGSSQPMEVRESIASYQSIKYIPLLRWDQISAHLRGEPVQIKDMLPISNIESSKSFALTVEGDGMESPQGDSFSSGCTIVIDPSLTPINHDYVIAHINNAPTFKQLIIDSGKQFLKPLNLRYPLTEMQDSIKIIGVVRMMMKTFR